MRTKSLLFATALIVSAALVNPAEAQRQRWPGGNNGRQEENGGGGGGRQRESGGSGGRQRSESGGGDARQQDGGRVSPRTAQPRGGERSADRGDGERRESPPVARAAPRSRTEAAPPQRTEAARPQTQGATERRADRAAIARWPDGGTDRGANGGAYRGTDGDSPQTQGATERRGNRAAVARWPDGGTDRGTNSGAYRGTDGDYRARSGSRVAVPRQGPPPRRVDGRYDGRNVYGSYYGGRTVYGRYSYGGARNIYIVPRGRTFIYYPRYYYTPYSFGYGPAGRGHFYFDLHYNSYIWHPLSVYRYDTYGSYGYPVGELRLQVRPRDAQVFIDGYYAGRVDEFDGVFQSLRLEAGEYQVEIALPGYEPLALDVRIFPGEKTTYRGDLLPELP